MSVGTLARTKLPLFSVQSRDFLVAENVPSLDGSVDSIIENLNQSVNTFILPELLWDTAKDMRFCTRCTFEFDNELKL